MIELIILIIIIIIVFSFQNTACNVNSSQIKTTYNDIVPCLPNYNHDLIDNTPIIQTIPEIVPIEPEIVSVNIPTSKKRISFSPRVQVRTFNINNGELVEQYSRCL